MDYQSETGVAASQKSRLDYDRSVPSAAGNQVAQPRDKSSLEIAFNRLENAKDFLNIIVGELSDRLNPVLHQTQPTQGQGEKRAHMGAPIPEAVMLQADYVENTALRLKELISRLAI